MSMPQRRGKSSSHPCCIAIYSTSFPHRANQGRELQLSLSTYLSQSTGTLSCPPELWSALCAPPQRHHCRSHLSGPSRAKLSHQHLRLILLSVSSQGPRKMVHRRGRSHPFFVGADLNPSPSSALVKRTEGSESTGHRSSGDARTNRSLPAAPRRTGSVVACPLSIWPNTASPWSRHVVDCPGRW
uniref:Uncharacterized protein n=1 Tax=Oryza nivara TaxID=4536 RepID=A0A0E0HXU2_ORYNI